MEKCEICGKEFSIMSGNHLKKHNTTYEEYVKKYFGTLENKQRILKERQEREKEEIEIYDDNIANLPDFKITNQNYDIKSIESKIDEIFEKSNKVSRDLFNTNNFKKVIKRKISTEIKKSILNESKNKSGKEAILLYLSSIFSNIKNNYFIEKRSLSNIISYRYVTDIVDLELKINFEFPNAFWHNQDVPKIVRDPILKRDGWKIVNILTSHPTIEDIKEELKKEKLI